MGSRETDVKALQKFLNAHGFPLAVSGLGSNGDETNFFGIRTRNVLTQFQEVNTKDIFIPLGLTKGTGIFAQATRIFINHTIFGISQ
jgi:hypothetical protein